MKVLFFGSTGWIGKQILTLLTNKNVDVIKSEARLDKHRELLSYLDYWEGDGITHCVLAAGLTGVPNVDWCEDNKEEVINVNVIGTYLIANWCNKNNIHITYLGTGCIYQYDELHTIENQVGFTELDKPNFDGSFYSETKIMIQDILSRLDNVLILRIRMPLSDDLYRKNFITKIISFEKVINIPNSMTVLSDLVPLIPQMMNRSLTGTYNFTNPGTVSHNELLDLYIKYIDPEFTYSNFSEEEQNKILKAKRSNNCLDSSKLLREFPEIEHISVSVDRLFQRMKILLSENETGVNSVEELTTLTEKLNLTVSPVKPLVILDLNGFLIDREYKKPTKDEIIPTGAERVGKFLVWKRSGGNNFLRVILKNFDVAVWSSVTKTNIRPLTEHVFRDFPDTNLKFMWCQDKCQSVKHPFSERKPLFLKNLSTVWDEFSMYDETNTFIIDDSELKMRNNPKRCIIKVPEWTRDDKRSDVDVLRRIICNLTNYIVSSDILSKDTNFSV